MANKTLVIGAGGQVGQALKNILGPEAILVGRNLVDLSVPKDAGRLILETKPEVVINAAAYTKVDQAEAEEALAYKINAESPLEMAKAAKKVGAKFLTYSTDYVYSGSGKTPWKESDPANPQNAYGRTKAAGEKLLKDWAPNDFQYAILRTSWIYAPQGKNFVLTMLKLGREREELKIVNDQIGAPTYAPELAQASLDILNKLDAKSSGIFNCAGAGETSWFHFAEEIFKRSKNLKVKSLLPITTAQYPTPAKRPLNSRLNQDLVFEKFGVKLSHWTKGLDKCLGEL